jgi:hypothetical protein
MPVRVGSRPRPPGPLEIDGSSTLEERTIDITTTGRITGRPPRIEIRVLETVIPRSELPERLARAAT